MALRSLLSPLIFLSLLLAFVVSVPAARAPAPVVPPLVHDGVRYVAPNRNGRVAYLEAYDIETGEQLWTTAVFRNRIDRTLEEDVQWVFVRSLSMSRGEIIVTDERSRQHLVDPTTGRVRGPGLRCHIGLLAGILLLCGAIWVTVRMLKSAGAVSHSES